MVKKKWSQLCTGDVFFIDEYKYVVNNNNRSQKGVFRFKNNIPQTDTILNKDDSTIYYVVYNMINKHSI